ncbi:NADH-ubiquinone oxidoreductase assembly factor N7BML [Trichoderma ghanense]|uniref:NADH-ubiquinone oxidoreductase assembly factor N7BML n=1 Tax=Trichoderma ghanense TaxID=65468 RepID=A0ABY2H962_9HYPO
MTAKQIGPFAQAWYKWKALRLPWRRRFFIGFDLQGNTFWEFRHTRGAQETGERWRRIVSYPRSTHLSQVKVSPQWHQWLRHARREPPSLDEQRAEAVRQERIKMLAAQADARWEAKPRVMEDPRGGTAPEQLVLEPKGRGLPAAEGDGGVKAAVTGEASRTSGGQPAQVKNMESEKPKAKTKAKQDVKDPWAKAKAHGPGEQWQPAAWNPSAAKKRR